MKRKFLAGVGALAAAGVVATAAWAALDGSWAAYPGPSTNYAAAVQQPIDSANTSNWSSKGKGSIPVMFKLSSGLGAPAFESIYSDNTTPDDDGGTCGTGSGADHANDCAFASFTPSGTVTFNDLTTLIANYTFTVGNCHGGSLRWSVRTSATQAVFIYYGDLPNFTDCTTSSQSGTNMIGLPDVRYDTSQYPGGTFYDTYSHAQALVGTTPIMRASLVLDSGWAGDQRLTLASAIVGTSAGDNTYTPPTPTAVSPTCDLPPATIKISKVSTLADGAVNETVLASSADTGTAFRVVDCKYQYLLSIPSLQGAGKYRVEIQIDGKTVGSAEFDLK